MMSLSPDKTQSLPLEPAHRLAGMVFVLLHIENKGKK